MSRPPLVAETASGSEGLLEVPEEREAVVELEYEDL